jgi:hypothetical protein
MVFQDNSMFYVWPFLSKTACMACSSAESYHYNVHKPFSGQNLFIPVTDSMTERSCQSDTRCGTGVDDRSNYTLCGMCIYWQWGKQAIIPWFSPHILQHRIFLNFVKHILEINSIKLRRSDPLVTHPISTLQIVYSHSHSVRMRILNL